MTAYEEESNKGQNEADQSLHSILQNENNWPSLGNTSHLSGNTGNTTTNTTNIGQKNVKNSPSHTPQSSQPNTGGERRRKHVKGIVQGAAWNSNK